MKSDSSHEAPKWPFRALRYLLKDEYLEELEGDMEEVFRDNLKIHSPEKAKRLFILEALKLLRPSLLRNFGMSTAITRHLMIKNNLKIAFRLFRKEKAYTTINVAGLATALAIALLIFQYVQFEFSYEDYNPKADRLIRLTKDNMNGATVVDQDCETNPPLGPLLAAELPEVEAFTRAYHIDQHMLKVGDEVYREPRTYAADPTFFELFNYKFIHGNPGKVFLEPHEVILTESTALKYYNKTDVVGETIYFTEIEKDFEVVAVVNDSPPNTHLKFDVLISYPTMVASLNEEDDNWRGNNTYTYVLLTAPDKYDHFKGNLAALNRKLQEDKKLRNAQVISEPVKNIHLYSDKAFEPEKNGDYISVFFLLGVAILVLVIAIVNYINLSTSKSLDRAKEVGIRKVVGSSLFQLRFQFFTESFVINIFGGMVAILLISVFLEQFRSLAQLPVSFSPFRDYEFWISLLTIITVSSVLSGIFPALILSSFKPVLVLKGKFSRSRWGNNLRQSLVIFQFFITLFLIIQTLTAKKQLDFMRQKDLGINTEQVIVVPLPDGASTTIRDELLTHASIKDITFSTMLPGLPFSHLSTTTGIMLENSINEHNYNFNMIWIDHNFISTMDVELLAGRDFTPEENSNDNVIVNEKALALWEVPDASSAVGQKIKLWGRQATIVGVIRNFHISSAKADHLPVLFLPSKGAFGFMSVRTAEGDAREHVALIKDIYKRNVKDGPFNFFFLDEEFNKLYQAEVQFQQVFGVLTGFAIFIACLGLYGLATFTISSRTKEISIRKVLGASVSQVIVLLSANFIKLVATSVLLAAPITWFITEKWLNRYAFRIEQSVWVFIVPAFALLAISFATIFFRTYKISVINPADSLKSE
ncbi:hypothetical protein C900_01307 [Fulvivirga imtechensis AK7]|uniref:ABC transporter permease n=1 Tax=Fulvivirga imtechensis AK7 TaxID=1237149 RepID=L8JY10_9BACT|nr:ABC transporter permease [Fulvivirga imtechensis]ELR72529.1 hypothetical protein C900_01307 [Fulvivirga imtechensis AK7]